MRHYFKTVFEAFFKFAFVPLFWVTMALYWFIVDKNT